MSESSSHVIKKKNCSDTTNNVWIEISEEDRSACTLILVLSVHSSCLLCLLCLYVMFLFQEQELEASKKEKLAEARLEAEVRLFKKENEALRRHMAVLQAEVYGARLAAKYLDKELAGRWGAGAHNTFLGWSWVHDYHLLNLNLNNCKVSISWLSSAGVPFLPIPSQHTRTHTGCAY